MRLNVFLKNIANKEKGKRHSPEMVRAIVGWIYAILARSSQEYSNSIHDDGILVPDHVKKVAKPFNFSRIYDTSKGPMLNVSSPDPKFIYHFEQGLKKKNSPIPELVLPYGNVYRFEALRKAEVPEIKYLPEQDSFMVKCYALTPIIIRGESGTYRSLDTSTGEEINSSLTTNLVDKYAALRGTRPANQKLSVIFKDFKIYSLTMTDKKGNVVHMPGHVGDITLVGDFDLILTALENGLGASPAMGYGFLAEHKPYAPSRMMWSDEY